MEGSEEQLEMKKVPYRSAVGSLLYAAIATRPDISAAVREVSKFCSNPGFIHWRAVKRILRYIKGTIDVKLRYDGSDSATLHGYVDSDFASCIDDRRSNTGYVFLLANAAISWRSKAQKTVATSTCEAEYMALYFGISESIHLRKLMSDMGAPIDGPILLHEDNQSCIALAKNPLHHSRSKHIDVKYHFNREAITNNLVVVEYIPTEHQVADLLTKPLERIKTIKFRNIMCGSRP